jgi:hypothetical protein
MCTCQRLSLAAISGARRPVYPFIVDAGRPNGTVCFLVSDNCTGTVVSCQHLLLDLVLSDWRWKRQISQQNTNRLTWNPFILFPRATSCPINGEIAPRLRSQSETSRCGNLVRVLRYFPNYNQTMQKHFRECERLSICS